MAISARAVRVVVFVVGGAGIAGMIVGSIVDNNGVALTFGLVTAVAALCLIVATAVGSPRAGNDAAAGTEVEDRITALVAAGADESALRDLVSAAVRLGRAAGG